MGQAKRRKQEMGNGYGKARKTQENAREFRYFRGGTCEIEQLADEPGRNWIRVRLDSRNGAGFQFECWSEDMHLLEESIACHFADAGKIVTLPLPAPEPQWQKWVAHAEPPAKSDKHHYILAHEDGRIETILCKRFPNVKGGGFPSPSELVGTMHAVSEKYHLDGSQGLPNRGFRLQWRDAGSMDGSAINKRVSNFLGFTCYGPVLFASDKQYSDGLKEADYNEIMYGLYNARELSADEIEMLVDRHLSILEIPLNTWLSMDFDEFRKSIAVSGTLYGFIRQIDERFRDRYELRLNRVRMMMRKACGQRTGDPQRITIMWDSEECDTDVEMPEGKELT